MARTRSVIVGGGLGTVGALVVGAFLSVAATDPATAQISPFAGETATGVIIAAGRVDPQPAATEVLRIKGGLISEGAGANSVVVGKGAASSGADGVAIGRAAIITVSNNGIAIGVGATSQGGTAIGPSANVHGTGNISIHGTIGSYAGTGGYLVIQGSYTPSGGNTSVVISGSSTSSFSCVIGGATGSTSAATAVGMSSTITAGLNNVIAIGASASGVRNGQIVIGATVFSQQITELRIGGETDASPVAMIWRRNNASGANNAAGSLTIQGSLSTGNAAPGTVIIAVGKQVAGSSSTLQTAYNHVTITNDATDCFTTLNAPTGSSSRLHFAVNATATAVIGTVGAAGGIVTGSTVGDLVIRTVATNTLFTVDGTTIPFYISGAGLGAIVNKDRNLRFDNHTSSAAAQAGTLTNAPTAGNPAHWLRISIAGVNHAIPCWLG